MLGVKEPENFYAGFGRVIHSVVEMDGRLQIEHAKVFTLKGLYKRYRKAFQAEKIPWPNEKQRADYYARGHLMIQNYVKIRRPRVVAVEHRFEVQLDGLPPVVGVIDRVHQDRHGNLMLIDYKTGNPPATLTNSVFNQLTLYAEASRQEFGQWPRRAEYQYLMTGDRIRWVPKKAQLRLLVTRYRKVVEAMRRGKFSRVCDNKWWCQNLCGYGISKQCPYVAG